jgi:hypothetical protein
MTEEEIMMRSGMIQPQPVVQTQQPNLFAQQKAANYPNSENLAQFGKETSKMAQKYAPMLIGQQPKTNEQVVTDRALQQTQNFNAPSTYKAPEPTKQAVDANDPNAGMEALLYTSPEEEERLRKASVQRQRIMAIGDALRHIGNIYNTVNYAPSQQFNNPAEEERRRYLQEKAYRDQNNYKYMTYQQAKAAQEAKQKQWEHDYALKMADAARKAGYTEAQIKNMQDKLAQQKAYQDASLAYRKENDEANRKQRADYQAQQIALGKQRVGIAAQNSRNAENYRQWKMKNGGNGGDAVPPLDTPNGQITPNGRNYGNQLDQIWSYAKENNLVKESDVESKLRALGYGKDRSADVRRQMVLDLLRTNQSLGNYAANRLGWKYGDSVGTSALSIGWDDEEDNEEDNELSIGW